MTNANVSTLENATISTQSSRRPRSEIAAIRDSLIVAGTCFITRDGIPARVLEVIRKPTSIKLSCEYVANTATRVRIRSLDSVVNQLNTFTTPEEFAIAKADIESKRASLPAGTPDNMPISSFPPPSRTSMSPVASVDRGNHGEMEALTTLLREVLGRIEKIELALAEAPKKPGKSSATAHS